MIVKLSDFGLATMDRFSADVDCGSAPYMSYGALFLQCFSVAHLLTGFIFCTIAECRNVVGPTYATQPAGA